VGNRADRGEPLLNQKLSIWRVTSTFMCIPRWITGRRRHPYLTWLRREEGQALVTGRGLLSPLPRGTWRMRKEWRRTKLRSLWRSSRILRARWIMVSERRIS
jgi:hypothetical protein